MKRVLAVTGATMLCTCLGASAPTFAVGSSGAVHAAVTRTPAGNYHPATPTRLVDTRHDLGSTGGALTTGASVTVPIAGSAGLPTTGVQAVVVNVAAAAAQAAGWFTAYPSGGSVPGTSTLNFRAGWTGSVTATIPVGADGKIVIRTGKGTSDLVVDVIGWYSAAGSTATGGTLLSPQDPYRLEDTRYNGGAIPASGTRVERFGFYDSSGSRLKAVVANVTAVAGSSTKGWLTMWDGVSAKPATSTLNYAPGEISPNTTVVPVSYLGADNLGSSRYTFSIGASGSGPVNVVVDIVGFYTTAADGIGAVFVPLSPSRLVDTRSGLGGVRGKRGTNSTTSLQLPNSLVSLSRTQAFAANLTGTGATKGSFMTIWSGTAPTDSSTTNIAPGRDRANGSIVLAPLNDTSNGLRYAVYNQNASADFVVDITGRFDTSPDQPAGAAKTTKWITSHNSFLLPNG